MLVGVLGLQGCIEPHCVMLRSLGVEAIAVRSAESLAKVDRLILPGGESTTILKLLFSHQLFDPLKNFSETKPTWGVCAGAILLAKTVENPAQESLAAIDVNAKRNFYGSQLDSFKAEIEIPGATIAVDFIRAPLLQPLSEKVIVLSRLNSQPILMRQNKVMVSSFHSELGTNSHLHKYFLEF